MKSLLAGAGTVAAVGGGGVFAFNHHFASRNGAKRILTYSSLSEALQEIENLKKAALNLSIEGEWSLQQHLTHCTQSIAYSMQGYPTSKSPLFQQTIGKLVFNTFEKQGYMRHNRHEPIPQAPPLFAETDRELAFNNLITTINNFENFADNLKPHFVYGELSKNQYAKVHAMHLADHFAIMTF